MREIAARLIQESEDRTAEHGPEDRRIAALLLLYDRLQPIVGPGGFQALLRQASQSLRGRHGDLGGLVSARDMAGMRAELRRLAETGSAEPDLVVTQLVEAVVRTLEQMIGSELAERLVVGPETVRRHA
ncbi:MAG: hypothetical protein ACLFRX_04110 [Gemmatimonadota bacterium]